MGQHKVTAHFVLADYYGLDSDRFTYILHWDSLWVEISTLACEANLLC